MRTPQGYRHRLRHYDEPGHAHYLTFSCYRNQSLLARERTCLWLIEAIQAAKPKHPFDLWAWVIMPSHVHLLLKPAEGVRVGNILKAVKEPVSKRASSWVKCNAPQFVARMHDAQPSGRRCLRFWQPGGGYDRNIVSAEEAWSSVMSCV